MSTASAPRHTPDDLLKMSDGPRYELVDGELVGHETSGLSALVAGTVNRLVGNDADEARLGYVFAPDCGYQ